MRTPGVERSEAAQIRFAAGEKNIVKDADRRAEINEFVEVVLHTARIQNRVGHQRGRHAADGQAVRTSGTVNIICRFSPAPARHVIGNNGRVAWNVFLQKGKRALRRMSPVPPAPTI